MLTDAEIMQTRWVFYLPPGYRYVNFGGEMHEKLSEQRGWDAFHASLDRFVPAFGPVQETNPQWDIEDQPAPEQRMFQNGGVSFVAPGTHPVILHRMDSPGEVAISYRSVTGITIRN